MMKQHCRIFTASAILVLFLFAPWTGAGWFHQHPSDPSCQVCKVLHASQADVAHLSKAPEPLGSSQRVIDAVTIAPANRLLSIPQGRAPPQA